MMSSRPSRLNVTRTLVVAAATAAVLVSFHWPGLSFWPHSTTSFRDDLPTVVEEIRGLSRLETASFQAGKIVEARSGMDPLPSWLVGDRVLLAAHGIVTAGVDLSAVGPGDVRLDGDTVRVRLPHATIFSVRLDDRSFVYDHHSGFLSSTDPQLESRARQKAEDDIRAAAEGSTLLAQANQNARSTISRLLSASGARLVTFDQP